MASGNLLYSTGSSARCSVGTQMGGTGVGGKEAKEGGDVCVFVFIYIYITLLYSRNQDKIVKQLYSSKKYMWKNSLGLRMLTSCPRVFCHLELSVDT